MRDTPRYPRGPQLQTQSLMARIQATRTHRTMADNTPRGKANLALQPSAQACSKIAPLSDG